MNAPIASQAARAERGKQLTSFIAGTLSREVPPLDFESRWELLRNGFRLFASCRATHASTQAAQSLASQVEPGSLKRTMGILAPR